MNAHVLIAKARAAQLSPRGAAADVLRVQYLTDLIAALATKLEAVDAAGCALAADLVREREARRIAVAGLEQITARLDRLTAAAGAAHDWLLRQRATAFDDDLDEGDCRICGSAGAFLADGAGHDPTDPCGIVAALLEAARG